MKYPKGIGSVLAIIAVGTLVTVAIVGMVIQKKNTEKRIQEEATLTTTIAEPTQVQPTSVQKTVTASDATDTKLDTDFSDIDTSMKAIDADATSIDAGLNDQMGDLSE